MINNHEFIQIICNCPDKETATNIASHLIELKLAACVNIIENVQSVYRWQGKIEHDVEFQLQIKTTLRLFAEVEKTLNELHPYDIVEVIALPIIKGHQPYLDWIRDNVKSS